MSGFVRLSKVIGTVLGLAVAGPAFADAPKIVSMNVCTDQLAMLVAAPEQIISLSHLARDPGLSSMVDQAYGFGLNHGHAEEIYLASPDLVLASTFSNPATVAMLRRVGLMVVQFEPVTGLEDIADRLTQMGEVLERQAAASTVVETFEIELAELDGKRLGRAAIYGPSGYYQGPRTLAGDILRAAGFATVSDKVGREYGGFLSLEELVLAEPDLLVRPGDPRAPSKAHALLDHPALAQLETAHASTTPDWVCGTPAVLGAVNDLRELAR